MICQTRSIESDEKEGVHQIYHRDTHYYVIISHNTSLSPYDWPFEITLFIIYARMRTTISVGQKMIGVL